MNTTNDKKPSPSGATGVVRGLTKCQSGPTKGSDTPVATGEGWEGAPRGIRNCNPLNIRRVRGTHWQGECSVQADKDFVQFNAMEWGLRAAFVTLRTYADKHKLHCICDIIRRWAPPSENDTERYIQDVCKMTGFGGQQRLTEKDWPRLIKAMARMECGVEFSDEIISLAYARSEESKRQKVKESKSS